MSYADRVKELKEIETSLQDNPELVAKRLARVIELILQDWKEKREVITDLTSQK
jgi:hypothetical protein